MTNRPLVEQLAAFLRNAIRAGKYPPGAALPGLVALAEEHGCSRNTALRAVRLLADEGYVHATQGRRAVVISLEGQRLTDAPPTAEERLDAIEARLDAAGI